MSHKQQHDAVKKSHIRDNRHERREEKILLHLPIKNDVKIHAFRRGYGTMEYNA